MERVRVRKEEGGRRQESRVASGESPRDLSTVQVDSTCAHSRGQARGANARAGGGRDATRRDAHIQIALECLLTVSVTLTPRAPTRTRHAGRPGGQTRNASERMLDK